jgi:beta-lactamase regulating signal transducer with metallopeptidase domain
VDTVLRTALSNAAVASALALVAVLAGYFCRRPALVHGLWLLVLLKLVTPPLVTVPIAWPAPPQQTAAVPDEPPGDTPLSPDSPPDAPQVAEEPSGVVVLDVGEPAQPEAPAEATPPETAAATPAPPPPFPWQILVGGAWLAGSAAWFLLAGWRVVRFHRLLRFAAPAPDGLRKMAERLAGKMGLPACPTILLVPGRVAPMLWSLGREPLLLVPAELLPGLTHEQKETLLAHELAHLRRRDHWVRALEFVTMGLYWWLPVVWYARRTLREAEEQCCDAWVVSLLPGAGKTYATALLETLDFLSDARPAPLLASGVGQVSDLKRRLTMIMCATTPRALTWRGTFAVFALGLFVLPLLPTLARAQAEESQAEAERQLAQARAELVQLQATLVAQNNLQAELQKARADLAVLEAQLKQKYAQVVQLENRLAAMKSGAGEPGALYRKVKTDKEVVEIMLRKVGDKWEVVQSAPGDRPRVIRREVVEEKDGKIRIVPIEMMPKPEDPKKIRTTDSADYYRAIPVPVRPDQPKPDNRIDSLEIQLKRIMLELESLRKEMKSGGRSDAGVEPGDPRARFTAPEKPPTPVGR